MRSPPSWLVQGTEQQATNDNLVILALNIHIYNPQPITPLKYHYDYEKGQYGSIVKKVTRVVVRGGELGYYAHTQIYFILYVYIHIHTHICVYVYIIYLFFSIGELLPDNQIKCIMNQTREENQCGKKYKVMQMST